MKVLRRDLQLSDSISSGLSSYGQFTLHSLVKLNSQSYGARFFLRC